MNSGGTGAEDAAISDSTMKLADRVGEDFLTSQRDDQYTVFTKLQKRWIVLLVAFAGMFSPLSSFIYYPAITSIAKDLNSTVELINLTITSYMIVSGVTPAIVGDLADMMGRRPIYILTFVIYCAANVGLAMQRSYSALLVLRMLQSFGGSGTIAIAYAVVADISSPAERGSYVGAVLCGPNVAPSLGPILGGVFAGRAAWPWIFWFLSILGGLCLMNMLLFLPETARSVVGNGSLPAGGLNRTCYASIHRPKILSAQGQKSTQVRQLRIPNPFRCLVVLFRKDTALIVTINGVLYMTYCCIQASLASLFIDIYGFKELEAGLIYLPFGVGCVLSSYVSGKIMNRDYEHIAKAHGMAIDRVRGDDLSKFPIEHARFRSSWYMLCVAVATITGYGWSLTAKAHFAVPLVLQFLIGGSITILFNMCGTLLTDLNPDNPATAQASNNIVRCALSAAGLAALQVLISHIGPGWTFTVFAGMCLLTVPLIYVQVRWGLEWRMARGVDAAPEPVRPKCQSPDPLILALNGMGRQGNPHRTGCAPPP